MAQALQIADGMDFPVLARQLFGNVRLHFDDGQENARKLASACFGACRVSELAAGAHTVRGERVVHASHDPDALKLLIQAEGSSVIEQGGRTVDFGEGAPVIYDPTRPYTLVNRTCVRLMMLQVPRSAFSQHAIRSLVAPKSPVRTMPGFWQVLRSTMQTSLLEADRLDQASRDSLGDMLVGLVRPIIEAEDAVDEAARPASLDVLLERAKGYIAANLDRPDLSLDRIAVRMGCSQRYLFRAFETEGQTPTRFIWNRRLDLARAELASPASAMRSITEIAFGLGFSSNAHFSRSFRNRYDISPRDCRRAALESVKP